MKKQFHHLKQIDKKHMSPKLHINQSGFTLVEVVAAIGMAAIGALTIVTLMTQGIGLSSRNNLKTHAASIAERIEADIQLPGAVNTKVANSILAHTYSPSSGGQLNGLGGFPDFEFYLFFDDMLEPVQVNSSNESGAKQDEIYKVQAAGTDEGKRIAYRAHVRGEPYPLSEGNSAGSATVTIKIRPVASSSDTRVSSNTVAYFFLLNKPQ